MTWNTTAKHCMALHRILCNLQQIDPNIHSAYTAMITVAQLEFYDASAGDISNEAEALALAKVMDSMLLNMHEVVYNEGYDQSIAVSHIDAVLVDKTKTMADLAAEISVVYSF